MLLGLELAGAVTTMTSTSLGATKGHLEPEASHVYRLYVRLVELHSIVVHDVFFILRLYGERRGDSDWHNFRVDVVKFCTALASVLRAFSRCSRVLPLLRSQLADQGLDATLRSGGSWFDEPSVEFGDRTWKLLDANDAARIFVDYPGDIVRFSTTDLTLTEDGRFRELTSVKVDFADRDAFADYLSSVKTKSASLGADLARLGAAILSKCDSRHLLD